MKRHIWGGGGGKIARWRKRRKVERERRRGMMERSRKPLRPFAHPTKSGLPEGNRSARAELRPGLEVWLATSDHEDGNSEVYRWYDILCHLKTTCFSRYLPNAQNINDLILILLLRSNFSENHLKLSSILHRVRLTQIVTNRQATNAPGFIYCTMQDVSQNHLL